MEWGERGGKRHQHQQCRWSAFYVRVVGLGRFFLRVSRVVSFSFLPGHGIVLHSASDRLDGLFWRRCPQKHWHPYSTPMRSAGALNPAAQHSLAHDSSELPPSVGMQFSALAE